MASSNEIFTPPDWLNQPLDPAAIQDRLALLNHRQRRLERAHFWALLIVGVFFVPGILIMGNANDGWRLNLGGAMMVFASFALLVGTVSSVLMRALSGWLFDFSPVPPEDQVKFDWLLERTPAAQALRDHLTAHPRAALHGELHRLIDAHQASLQPRVSTAMNVNV